jgi:hypothetical protein
MPETTVPGTGTLGGAESPSGAATSASSDHSDRLAAEVYAFICDGDAFANLPDCEACGGCGKDTRGTEFADEPATPDAVLAALKPPPWWAVEHCCEAGATAYPNPCIWHAVSE